MSIEKSLIRDLVYYVTKGGLSVDMYRIAISESEMRYYGKIIPGDGGGDPSERVTGQFLSNLGQFLYHIPGTEWFLTTDAPSDQPDPSDFCIVFKQQGEGNTTKDASSPIGQVDYRKKQADQAKKLYQVLNPEVSRVCDRIKDILIPYGTIDRWMGYAYTADELQSIGYDDFHVPSIGVRKMSEPGKEATFLIFISDGSDWGEGSRLIFTTVSVWLAEGFRAHDANLHLSIQLGDRGDRMKVFLEKKIPREVQRLMHGDGRD